MLQVSILPFSYAIFPVTQLLKKAMTISFPIQVSKIRIVSIEVLEG